MATASRIACHAFAASGSCRSLQGDGRPRKHATQFSSLDYRVSPPGIEPGLRPSQSRVPPPHSEDKKSRRLDSHQHGPRYGRGAFLYRATSASAGAQGFEPCRATLEIACSPRSTLLLRVSEGNRTRCLDVHSVACHPATPQTPSVSSPGWIRTSDLPHVTGMSCP